MVIHWKICYQLGFDNANQWGVYTDQELFKCTFAIQTNPSGQARRGRAKPGDKI